MPIPLSLQGVLWSAGIKKINIERDKEYIIHQVLTYGTLEQIKWLFKIYGKDKVRRVFLQNPQPIYDPAIFYLVKNIILGLKKNRLIPARYVKTVF